MGSCAGGGPPNTSRRDGSAAGTVGAATGGAAV